MSGYERASTRQRRRRMVELLEDGGTNVHDLAAEFGVSLSTVRRDLAALAGSGSIVRTYGGAVDNPTAERSLRYKQRTRRSEKAAIAAMAASLVRSGDVVLLDGGTTVSRVAHYLRDRTDVTIVTIGLSTIIELADAEVEVIVLGGRLRRPNEVLLGSQTERALHRVSPDVAFLGADSVDPIRGINCPDFGQAAVKETMADGPHVSWVLADHSKLRHSAGFPYWAAMPKGTGLITDKETESLEAYASHGWLVRVCQRVPSSETAADHSVPTQRPPEQWSRVNTTPQQ